MDLNGNNIQVIRNHKSFESSQHLPQEIKPVIPVFFHFNQKKWSAMRTLFIFKNGHRHYPSDELHFTKKEEEYHVQKH